MTWDVEDCAIMLQTIAGHDGSDPASSARPVPDYRAMLGEEIRKMRIGVVRHFWEDDLPANDEVKQAMEAALEVFRELGATIEEVRLRPLHEYYDVKMIIGETEIFAIHERDLIKRASDFSRDFLGRCLPACMFTAMDYYQAQRQRRRMQMEMHPVYDRYDVLVIPSLYGPAPKLGIYNTLKWVWQRPAITAPFSIAGGPAISICNGFSATGLPLGMQLYARPFNEVAVFHAASAYERATTWRERRPQFEPEFRSGPSPGPVTNTSSSANIGSRLRGEVADAVRRAGLHLDEEHFERLCELAPHVEAMRRRLRRDCGYEDDAANIPRFPREAPVASCQQAGGARPGRPTSASDRHSPSPRSRRKSATPSPRRRRGSN